MTVRNLEARLKDKYGIIAGEMTLDEIRRKLSGMSQKSIKVSGRSYETGKRKVVHVPSIDLLN